MGAEHLHKLPGLRNACASKHQATNDLRLVDSYICIYHFEHAHKILSANFKFVFRIWKPPTYKKRFSHCQVALPQPSSGAFAVACRTPAMILPQHASSQTQWQLESPAATQALNMNHPRGGRTSDFRSFQ